MASVLTSKGREVTAASVNGTAVGVPKVLAWGVPSAQFTAAVSDVAVFAETAEARVTGTNTLVTTTTANDTFQSVGTLTATGSRAITEVALLDSSTKPSSSTITGGTAVGVTSAGTLILTAAVTATTVQVRSEVMTVTAGSGTTTLTVTRASNGSTATASIAVADVVTAGNIPSVATVTGGTVFAHFDFAVINLSTGNTLQSTCQVQYQ